MKKILIILLFFNYSSFAQKLYFTPSLGWGIGFGSSGSYTQSLNSNAQVDYNARPSISDFFANPQTGYFLEYRINEHHQIGIGRMTGITEYSSSIKTNNFSTYSSFEGMYRKLGLTYTYLQNRWQYQIGAFASNNRISDIPTGYGNEFTNANYDWNGVLIDSSFTGDRMVRPWGFTTSLAVGYAIMNREKNRERFTLNLLVDIGWNKLSALDDKVIYDYDKTITSTSFSKGSQIKFYLSKPILLYDVKKDRYNIFK